MAKYTCPYCSGFVHTSGGIPNHSEWLMFSAVAHDAFPDTVSSADLYRQATMLYRCMSCDAIAVFWSGFKQAPTWYAPLRE
jgi:hypothetical protein